MGNLSAAFPRPEPAPSEADEEGKSAPLRPACILCVDDDRNVLAALLRLFRRAGFRVLTADSGVGGLEALDSEQVDVVISDMRMPEMDGARFLRLVRERWPHTMRLLLTGFSDYQSIRDAIQHGEIYSYIPKPWDDADIVQVVRQALEQREQGAPG
jgi:DNA-binding NtrC family response regulator